MTNADKEAVYTYLTTLQKAALVTGDKEHQAPARFCTADTEDDDCDTAGGETCAVLSGDDGECIGGACTTDADCGACQTCDGGTMKCVAENPSSTCVKLSLSPSASA